MLAGRRFGTATVRECRLYHTLDNSFAGFQFAVGTLIISHFEVSFTDFYFLPSGEDRRGEKLSDNIRAVVSPEAYFFALFYHRGYKSIRSRYLYEAFLHLLWTR